MNFTPEMDRKKLKIVLKERWDIDADHWLPLSEPTTNEEMAFFPQHSFFNDFGLDRLKSILAHLSDGGIYQWNWETREQDFFTIKIEEMVEFENLEKYYFDDSCDWVVYISHENTIAFGGEKLIEILVSRWENWFLYLNEWEAK